MNDIGDGRVDLVPTTCNNYLDGHNSVRLNVYTCLGRRNRAVPSIFGPPLTASKTKTQKISQVQHEANIPSAPLLSYMRMSRAVQAEQEDDDSEGPVLGEMASDDKEVEVRKRKEVKMLNGREYLPLALY